MSRQSATTELRQLGAFLCANLFFMSLRAAGQDAHNVGLNKEPEHNEKDVPMCQTLRTYNSLTDNI